MIRYQVLQICFNELNDIDETEQCLFGSFYQQANPPHSVALLVMCSAKQSNSEQGAKQIGMTSFFPVLV